MSRIGFIWAELAANNAKLVRVLVVSDSPEVREE